MPEALSWALPPCILMQTLQGGQRRYHHPCFTNKATERGNSWLQSQLVTLTTPQVPQGHSASPPLPRAPLVQALPTERDGLGRSEIPRALASKAVLAPNT